jgi:hypothetical protein
VSRPPSEGKRVRLNLELPERARERLERVRAATEAESSTAAICRALIVYEALLEAKAKGARLVIVHKNGREETLVLLG